MSHKDVEKLRRSVHNWTQSKMHAIYKKNGFFIDNQANHDAIYHGIYGDLETILPRHRKVKPCYVRIAADLIEQATNRDEK